MLFILALLLLQAGQSVGAYLQPRQTASVPDFVTKYAPLVYLDQNELYLPSDIQAQLNNTNPTINYTTIRTTQLPSPLLLSDLEQLNIIGSCTQFGTCPVYLTSKDNVTTNPPWLYGVLPSPVTFETVGAKSCAIIVNDHGSGIVDAFYMYFYAFNLGETVFGQVLGDHVGDWEHSMVRFVNGSPVAVWLSQHDYGQAFTYECLSKNGSRPIIYSAIGSHANFAVPGLHSRNISGVAVNDYTSNGPIWDPTLSAYYYAFTASSSTNGSFVPSDSSTPIEWLYFLGQWGDEQYPDSDPVQVNFLNLNVTWKYESGPTGPLDKGLNRTDTCPYVVGMNCSTLSSLPATSGSSIPVTVTRSTSSSSAGSTATSASTTAASSAGSSASSTGSATASSSTSKSDARRVKVSSCGIGMILLANLIAKFL